MAFLFAPLPWRLRIARPYAATIVLGLLLRANVVRRIAPIRKGVAVSNKPSLYIDAAHGAHGDSAAVAICVSLAASDRRRADEFVKCHRGDLAAAIGLARGVKAGLPFLGRVNSMEPDALSMDFDRVAVYDRRSPDDVRQRKAGKQYKGCDYE